MRCFKLLGERVLASGFDRPVAELQIRAASLSTALAGLSPVCHRLVVSVVPEGPLGSPRNPWALAALVRSLEAAGWQVRLDAIPVKDSALTGVVLIEGRRGPANQGVQSGAISGRPDRPAVGQSLRAI